MVCRPDLILLLISDVSQHFGHVKVLDVRVERVDTTVNDLKVLMCHFSIFFIVFANCLGVTAKNQLLAEFGRHSCARDVENVLIFSQVPDNY